ncbi:hypothetical protein Ndes2437B_g05864 [Nannochloris sp. 'desiccata']
MGKNKLVAKQMAMRQQIDAQEAEARNRNLQQISATKVDHRQYAESDASLKDLRPISFRRMQVGKVHKGRLLKGTIVGPACKFTGVMVVLQDEDPDIAVLVAIYNKLPQNADSAAADRVFPEGARLAIKEPYLKQFNDGSLGVRVDSPSDVVFLKSTKKNDGSSAGSDVPSSGDGDVAALRAQAGDLYKKKDYTAALDLYNQCVSLEPTNATHFSNIAAVHFATENWELAYKAASCAYVLDAGNVKAAYRKAKSMQKLRCYAGAALVLQGAPADAAITAALKEAKVLAAQAANASFDLLGIYTGNVKSEVADYVGPVKIFNSPTGRGLCVTKEVLPGELLFVENPLVSSSTSKPSLNINTSKRLKNTESHTELISKLYNQCSTSAVFSRRVKVLYDGRTPLWELTTPEMHNLICPFETEADLNKVLLSKAKIAPPSIKSLAGIASENTLGQRGDTVVEDTMFGPKSKEKSTKIDESSLYVLTSIINHSCVSNASLLALPCGAIVVRAAVELKPGDKVFIQYIDVAKPLKKRRKMLKSGWGFKCKCPRCVAEVKLPKNVTDLLSSLAEDTKYDGNSCGIIARMQQKLNQASDKDSAKEALWYTICPRIEEVERALTATGLPATQLNWFKASVLSAYLIMKEAADIEKVLQIVVNN